MRGLILPVVCMLLLAAVPFSGLGAGGPTAQEVEAEPELSLASAVGTTTSHLVWSTTAGGDRAIRMELQFDALEQCGFYVASAGWIHGNDLFHYSGHEGSGRGWAAVTNDQTLGAHAANVAVRFGTLPFDLWVAQSLHGFSATGTMAWLYAGFDLAPVDHEWTGGKSLVFDLQCTGPFTITKIEGGRDLVGFVPSYMEGGVGATVLGTTLNGADRASGFFSDPHVAYRFRTDSLFQTGLLTVSAPGGAGGTHFLSGDSDIAIDGPGGFWDSRVVRAASDKEWSAIGLLIGLQEVQSLDEAASL